MHRVEVTEATLALLDSRRVYTRPGGGRRLMVGDVLGVHPDCRLEPYSHLFAGLTVPRGMGAFSYSHSPIDLPVRIGRYCSLGIGIRWLGPPHPTDHVSTSGVFLGGTALAGAATYFAETGLPIRPIDPAYGVPPTEVGHDVWIGDEAAIKPGVRIGDGAIVGARALVLRDVPPYAIVGGTPARIIRFRLPEDLVERMLKAAWWNYPPNALAGLDMTRPEQFLAAWEARPQDGARAMRPRPLTAAEMAAA